MTEEIWGKMIINPKDFKKKKPGELGELQKLALTAEPKFLLGFFEYCIENKMADDSPEIQKAMAHLKEIIDEVENDRGQG